MAGAAAALLAAVAGLPPWFAASTAAADRPADTATALAAARTELPAATTATFGLLRDRLQQLAATLPPDAGRAAMFAALEPAGIGAAGAAAWPADAADAGAVAWSGRRFPRPTAVASGLQQQPAAVATGTQSDGLRLWAVAGRHIQGWHVLVAEPLGPLDPPLARVVGPGPMVRAAAAAGVTVWLREPAAGVEAVETPLTTGDSPGMAWVVVPPAAARVRWWTERAAGRAGLPLGLAIAFATLALGQWLRRSGWPESRQQWAGAALPWLARTALALCGTPPAVPGLRWLAPSTYSAATLPWAGGPLPLGPFAGWFATPLDLLLTAVAALGSVAILAARGLEAAAPVRRSGARAAVHLLVAAAGARVVLALLAGIVASLGPGCGVELLPGHRFLFSPAEALLLSSLAALGLGAFLGFGLLGDRMLRAAADLAGDRRAAAVALAAGVAVALIPLGVAPWWLRLLAVAGAAAATAIHRMPPGRDAYGFTPALLRLLCATALVHAAFEHTLAGARAEAARAAVEWQRTDAAWLQDVQRTAERLAADPVVHEACDAARALVPFLEGPELAVLPEEFAVPAARAWAGDQGDPSLPLGTLEVAAEVPGFDRYRIMEFGVNAPRSLRRLARGPVPRGPPGSSVGIGHTVDGMRIATARAPVRRGDAAIGLVIVTVPDPYEPEAIGADRWVPAPRRWGLAGVPTLVRYRQGVAQAATDARLQLTPMPAGAAAAATAVGPVTFTQTLGDTPYRFWAALDRDASVIRAAGLPAPEPGPMALRFARVLVLALLVGLGGLIAARRARFWFGLPPLPPWRRRFKHLLVAAFLLLTVPPFVLMAIFSQGLLRTTLPAAARTNHREALELARANLWDDVREFDARGTGAPEGFTTEKVEALFGDAYLAERSAVLGHELHVFDPRGGLLSTSMRDLFRAGVRDPRLPGAVARALLAEGQASAFQTVEVGGQSFREGYRVLRNRNDAPVGVLAIPVRTSDRHVAARLARTITLIYAMSLMAVMAVASIALLLSRRLARPMEALTAATRQVAAGDLATRVPVTRGDELGDLQRAFNQMADELAESRARLIQAEKEAAWRQMAQQIAHEVKNPLTPLKLHAQHLQRAYRDDAPGFGEILQDATQRIIDQVEALRKVASRFSAFAGREGAEPVEVDVNALAMEALDLYRRADSTTIFGTTFDQPPPRVRADRDDLRRVLINLITNALQAMPSGGELDIRTVRSKRPAPPGRKGGTTRRIAAPPKTDAPHGWVGIEVRDSGPGIPPIIQERLFEPYFSTKTSGTGLGLWICRSTVEEMGGEISLTSVAGAGTSAWVWLPRLPDPEPPSDLELTGGAPGSQETPDSSDGPPDGR